MPKPNPTVSDIVRDWLLSHGYDGLFSNEGECACLANDLFPCGYTPRDCEAGYKMPCPNPDECEYGPEDHWHIGREDPDE